MVKKTLLLAGVAASMWIGNQAAVKADDCYRGGYSSFRPTVPSHSSHGHSRYGSNYGFYPGYGIGYVPGYGAGYGSYRPPVGIPGSLPCDIPRYSSGYGSGYGPGSIGNNFGPGGIGFANPVLGNPGLGGSWGSYGSGGFPRSGSFGNSYGNVGGFGPGFSLYIGR